jgi:hypothetical protein
MDGFGGVKQGRVLLVSVGDMPGRCLLAFAEPLEKFEAIIDDGLGRMRAAGR